MVCLFSFCFVFKCAVLLEDMGYERLQKEKTGPCFGLTALSHLTGSWT